MNFKNKKIRTEQMKMYNFVRLYCMNRISMQLHQKQDMHSKAGLCDFKYSSA